VQNAFVESFHGDCGRMLERELVRNLFEAGKDRGLGEGVQQERRTEFGI